jgi:hypothetical protein
MGEEQEDVFEQAIAYDKTIPVRFYLQVSPGWRYYREQAIEMLFEARRCFMSNCPRAAAILAGETLLRAIYDRILYLLGTLTSSNLRGIAYGTGRGRTNLYELSNKKEFNPYDLVDEITFEDAIKILEQSGLYQQPLLERIYQVKALRNVTTHKEYPLIDEWDPDDPRPEEEYRAVMEAMLARTWVFPEGYRIWNERRKEWIKFDCREFNCTLKQLGTGHRIAAIQLHFVQAIIKDFSTGVTDRFQGAPIDIKDGNSPSLANEITSTEEI